MHCSRLHCEGVIPVGHASVRRPSPTAHTHPVHACQAAAATTAAFTKPQAWLFGLCSDELPAWYMDKQPFLHPGADSPVLCMCRPPSKTWMPRLHMSRCVPHCCSCHGCHCCSCRGCHCCSCRGCHCCLCRGWHCCLRQGAR